MGFTNGRWVHLRWFVGDAGKGGCATLRSGGRQSSSSRQFGNALRRALTAFSEAIEFDRQLRFRFVTWLSAQVFVHRYRLLDRSQEPGSAIAATP